MSGELQKPPRHYQNMLPAVSVRSCEVLLQFSVSAGGPGVYPYQYRGPTVNAPDVTILVARMYVVAKKLCVFCPQQTFLISNSLLL